MDNTGYDCWNIGVLGCVFILAPAISKPLTKLKDVLYEFSLGNYNFDVEIKSKDEVGELAEMMRKLKKAQNEKIQAAEAIAEGRFEKVNPASEKDVLALAFNKEIETIEELFNEASKLIEANQQGNLSVRGNATKFAGKWRNLLMDLTQFLIHV